MKFRIRARNPKTQQAHHFEVESASRGDARHKVEDAGLVPSSIEPVAAPDAPPEAAAPESHPPPPPAPRRRRRFVNGVLLAGIIVAVGATVKLMLGSGATTFASLDASIRFDGFQFKIVNQDDFAWHDVRLDLNGGLANSGYMHRPGTLVAGQAYTAPVTAFADEGGNRFSVITDSPRQMTITCELDDGQTARYTRRWN
ncbi:MAG: hypothetical protein ACYSUR_17225 [Planctomycetota bacterium]|jgi:hypothetical protein